MFELAWAQLAGLYKKTTKGPQLYLRISMGDLANDWYCFKSCEQGVKIIASIESP